MKLAGIHDLTYRIYLATGAQEGTLKWGKPAGGGADPIDSLGTTVLVRT